MRLQFKYRINQRRINLCVVTIAELCYIRFVFRTDSVHKNACIYLTSNSTFRLFGVRMGLITKIRFLTLLCFFRNRFWFRWFFFSEFHLYIDYSIHIEFSGGNCQSFIVLCFAQCVYVYVCHSPLYENEHSPIKSICTRATILTYT